MLTLLQAGEDGHLAQGHVSAPVSRQLFLYSKIHDSALFLGYCACCFISLVFFNILYSVIRPSAIL